MEQFIKLVRDLVETPTVSGFEKQNLSRICDIAKEYTGIQTEVAITPAGSVLLGRMGADANAKKLVLDAHIDTIGFMVTKHYDGGFVQVTNIGGIDTGILYSHGVELYGKRTVKGFFVSTPPHLSKDNKKGEISDILIDTGLCDDELKEICPIGTPCGFESKLTHLMNGRISCKNLDDKICAAAALQAFKLFYEKESKGGVELYVHLSVGEEKSLRGGATFAYNFRADACIVLDVNFAKEKTSHDGEYLEFDKGPGVSVSAATSISFTDAIYKSALKNSHKIQRVVEMVSTGTNANVLGRKYTGTQTAVLSIPLRYMHTSVETVSVSDALECAEVLCDFARDCGNDFPVESFRVIKGGGNI